MEEQREQRTGEADGQREQCQGEQEHDLLVLEERRIHPAQAHADEVRPKGDAGCGDVDGEQQEDQRPLGADHQAAGNLRQHRNQ